MICEECFNPISEYDYEDCCGKILCPDCYDSHLDYCQEDVSYYHDDEEDNFGEYGWY